MTASILFVDDDVRVLKSLKATFQHTYRVRLASSGAEALGILDKENVDVLVSDERMPSMSGLELLGMVRDQWPQTKRLILAGFVNGKIKKHSGENGLVFQYVRKPWSTEELKDKINCSLQSVDIQGSDTSKESKQEYPFLVIGIGKAEEIKSVTRGILSPDYLFGSAAHVIHKVPAEQQVGIILLDLGLITPAISMWLDMFRRKWPDVAILVFGRLLAKSVSAKLKSQLRLCHFVAQPQDVEEVLAGLLE